MTRAHHSENKLMDTRPLQEKPVFYCSSDGHNHAAITMMYGNYSLIFSAFREEVVTNTTHKANNPPPPKKIYSTRFLQQKNWDKKVYIQYTLHNQVNILCVGDAEKVKQRKANPMKICVERQKKLIFQLCSWQEGNTSVSTSPPNIFFLRQLFPGKKWIWSGWLARFILHQPTHDV